MHLKLVGWCRGAAACWRLLYALPIRKVRFETCSRAMLACAACCRIVPAEKRAPSCSSGGRPDPFASRNPLIRRAG